jgi:hypothetical protein
MWFEGPVFDTWQSQGFSGDKSRILFLDPTEYWIGRFIEIVQPITNDTVETSLVRSRILFSGNVSLFGISPSAFHRQVKRGK